MENEKEKEKEIESTTFVEPEDRDYRKEILEIIRGDYTEDEIKEKLEEYHDNDIAGVLDDLEADEREPLNEVIGNEAMSEIVPFMEDAGQYLSELDAEEAAEIIEHMDADEALEVLEHIDDEEVKEEIELLDSYDEDQFGSKMSTNFIVIKRGLTVKAAMKSMVGQAAENDNINTIFVENEDGTFYGAIGLKELIIARSTDDPEELICTTFPYVYDNEIVSENIERLRGYSEDMIPVLCAQSGKMLGVITSHDIIDIVDEELGDDYAKLAALGSEEEHDETLLMSMKKRVPWLVALLFMGLAVSAVVGLFEGVVSELPMIVAFQSLILGMAGNVGTQSLAVTVRTLGSDEDSNGKRQLGIILKETRVALCNGFAIGITSFLIVALYLCLFGHYSVAFALPTAGCVGMAMCFAMMISGFTGAAIPIGLYRFGLDPAVASGPLITTVNDLVAVISYYGLAWTLLLKLGL